MSWKFDPTVTAVRRLGLSPEDLGNTGRDAGCPDVLELSNGDIAVIGWDATDVLAGHLPDGAKLSDGERLIVIPRNTFESASQAD